MSFVISSLPLSPVAGTESTSEDVFGRIGTFSTLGERRFVAYISTTDAANAAEIRLFDLGLAAPVAGSTLSSISTQSERVEALVTLPDSDFDVQLRLTTADPDARAVCTAARIELG